MRAEKEGVAVVACNQTDGMNNFDRDGTCMTVLEPGLFPSTPGVEET